MSVIVTVALNKKSSRAQATFHGLPYICSTMEYAFLF